MDGCAGCRVGRRSFLATGVAAAFAGPSGFIGDLLARQDAAKGARACILLWMGGGPSQLDTFDPKPGQETGGEFQALGTAVPGISIAETLPGLAREMKRFSIVRNLATPEGDHGRASYLMHTGYRQLEGSPSPAVGSMFSHELGKSAGFPQYVAINTGSYGPAFLGFEHAPFRIDDPATTLATIQAVGSGAHRIDLMNSLQERYGRTHAGESRDRREAMVRGLAKLADTPFAKALDLSEEKDELKEAYGTGAFGQGCLLARRLVEAGTRFVEVELSGWDTHADNFNQVRELSGQLDPAMATLLRDLDSRGLLKETVVLWTGEFGRTPAINGNNGRDHWPQATPAVVAGGLIRGGRVVGGTDRAGREIQGTPLRVQDLFATLYRACGIEIAKKFFNREGKLMKSTDGGVPIRDLLA